MQLHRLYLAVWSSTTVLLRAVSVGEFVGAFSFSCFEGVLGGCLTNGVVKLSKSICAVFWMLGEPIRKPALRLCPVVRLMVAVREYGDWLDPWSRYSHFNTPPVRAPHRKTAASPSVSSACYISVKTISNK